MSATPPLRILRADPSDPVAFAVAIAAGAQILRCSGLVAFPTETVYGLGANAFDAAAVRRIYAAKGRPSFNPLIVHLADSDWLPRVVTAVPEIAKRLATAFWPGPLTLVLPRHADVPVEVSAGLPTVGVRVPAHPVATALLAAADLPIAAPSANLFTRISPTTAAHVIAQLADRVDLVLDGGATAVGIESTVVDVTGPTPVLLRPGGVAAAAIEAVVGPLARPAELGGDAPRPAPGMIERHYAPQARLVGFASSERAQMQAALRQLANAGQRAGLIAFDVVGGDAAPAIQMPADAVGYARRLYAALHQLDEAGCRAAWVELPPSTAAWDAVRDRLRRAGLGLSDS
jgi:L-threonylcarbamoyladenylate synthase